MAFGLIILVAVVAVAGIVITHLFAAPGTEVSFMGLVKYTKTEQKEPAFEPITVHDAAHHLKWRLARNPHRWLDRNISSLTMGYVDQALVGPFHDECFTLMQLITRSAAGPGMESILHCAVCDEDMLLTGRDIDIHNLKVSTLAKLQSLHVAGKSIEDNMKL